MHVSLVVFKLRVKETFTRQELGENALLARVLLEAIGSFARAVGPAYSNGSLLRTALLPFLEKLGDASPGVAATAEVALRAVCFQCGYAGLSELVAANLDYIVDGACSQFRRIDCYPRQVSKTSFRLRVDLQLCVLQAQPM